MMEATSAARPRFRTAVAASLALGLVLGVMVSSLRPRSGSASSHREAPLTAADPRIDTTDLYAFNSPDDPATTTLIANWIPFEEPAGGPNFFTFEPGAHYDIDIDNNGDSKADIIYRWIFKDHYRDKGQFLYNTGQVTTLTDPDLNFYQTYTLKRKIPGKSTKTLLSDAMVAPSDVGEVSMPDYGDLRDEAVVPFTDGGAGQSFAGQADDPFALDLRVFDLLYGTDFSEAGDDTLAGFNVNSVALQVPKTALAKGGNPANNPVIGVWSVTARRSTRVHKGSGSIASKGDFVSVSRLGNPLVNEVVIPLRDKDRFNASKPSGDGQFLSYVNDPILPKLINAVYGIPVPDSDPDTDGVQRGDLIDVFLKGLDGLNRPKNVTPSEMLRLNLTTPTCEAPACSEYSRLGVIGGDSAGFPNGRRLADDVIDIALQVVEGELVGNPNDLSDGVDNNDVAFSNAFPYLALPHHGSDPDPH